MRVELGMEVGEGLGEWTSGWSLFLFLARTPEGGGRGGLDSSDKDESDESKRQKLMMVSSSPEEGGGQEVDDLCEGG